MHALDAFVLIRRLWQLGYITAPNLWEALEISESVLRQAIERYQEFNHLMVDGWVGPETKASLEETRFCGFPDLMPIQVGGLCRWPQKRITWTLSGQLPGISSEARLQAYQRAWQSWANVCDIVPVYNPGDPAANVQIGVGAIDGGMGTLAWSELPCGNAQTLRQLYDQSERWVITDGITQGQQIDLTRVARHEIGHVLGIPHIAAGNLLAPTYRADLFDVQAGDIAEAVKRYGPSTGQPPLPPTPLEEITVTFTRPVTKIVIRPVS